MSKQLTPMAWSLEWALLCFEIARRLFFGLGLVRVGCLCECVHVNQVAVLVAGKMVETGELN